MITPAELRFSAHYYTELAAKESTRPLRRLVTRHAFALAQLAEKMEREGEPSQAADTELRAGGEAQHVEEIPCLS